MFNQSLVVAALFGLTKADHCPAPLTIQSDEVKANFSYEAFNGIFYEVAFHDYT